MSLIAGLFFVLVRRRPVVEDAGVAGLVVSPVAGVNDGFVRHAGMGFAGVARRQVVRRRVAGRDVVRMVGR